MFMILTSPRNRLLRTWEHTSVCLTCPWPQSHDLDCTNSVSQGLPELLKKKKNPSTHQILAFNSFNSLIFKMDTNNIWRSMNKSMNDNCAAIYGTDSKGPHTDMDYGISVRVCVQESGACCEAASPRLAIIMAEGNCVWQLLVDDPHIS